jgi:hypothetical protein
MFDYGIELNNIKIRADLFDRCRSFQFNKFDARILAEPHSAGGKQPGIDVRPNELGVRVNLRQHIEGMPFSATKIENLQAAVAR